MPLELHDIICKALRRKSVFFLANQVNRQLLT